MRVFFIFLLFTVGLQAQTDPQVQQHYHDFDFWLGTWDVYVAGSDQPRAQSHIESIIDSVGVLENYKLLQGPYQGKSINKYNAARQRWEQLWIDNGGLSLFLSGNLEGKAMVMTDEERPLSEGTINKIRWEPQANGDVRQTWTSSTDGGKTWNTVFDGMYKRKDL